MAAAPIRIGLLWHSPNSGNLGVAALTLANMAIARQVAVEKGLAPRFVIIGMRDHGPFYVRPDDADFLITDSRFMATPGGYWSAMRGIDCILDIGAGDSFAEIYGPKRFAFLWLSKMMAVWRKVPLLLCPQTIGPFEREPYRMLAARAMEQSAAVIARDKPSLAAIAQIAPKARRLLATDVAFALPYEDRKPQRDASKVRVGVNVSGLLFHDAESGRNRFKLGFHYADLTRELLRGLSAREDVEIHLITHTTESDNITDDDGRACDAMQREFPNAIRAPNFDHPSRAKSYISGLNLLVAGRMHACIGAFSAGIPVVPVAYSRKFSGLFGSLGYRWIVPAQGMGTDEACRFVLDCVDKRQTLQDDLGRSMEAVSSLLDVYRAELANLYQAALI